jgi:hypothetical protein
VARLGPKRPLVAGPIITAIGFLIFTYPSVGGSYWATFFPGFVVLGLGMAISVAPLTTVVMDAADRGLAGTASGVNNAVARIASLLAVAVFGMVMVGAFGHALNQRLKTLPLPRSVMAAVQSNEVKLAAINLAEAIDPVTASRLQASIDQAFVFGFRVILLLCAGLSVVGSGVALCMIGGRRGRATFRDADSQRLKNHPN